MRNFNYTQSEFQDVIMNNPNFSFKNPLSSLRKEPDHGCSFYSRIPDGGMVVFHNFDLNSSYHVHFSPLIFGFNHESLVDYIKSDIGIIFNTQVENDIDNAYQIFMKEVNTFLTLRSSEYSLNLTTNVKIYYNKEDHEYKGFDIRLTLHLDDTLFEFRKGVFVDFSFSGGGGLPIEITGSLPSSKDNNRESLKFIDEIPTGSSVLQHWIGRCKGSPDSTLEEALDGLERLDYSMALKEMQEI